MSTRRKASRAARGYGAAHKQRRRALEPQVAAGLVACARCGQRIEPGQAWHLDHTDDRRGYNGATHARCNTRAAALRTNALKAEKRAEHAGYAGHRWSRIWFEPVPPGTRVYNADGTYTDY